MTKKETQMLNREKVKLADQHRGIKDMRKLPDVIVIVDAQYEDTAIREAKRLDIPIIAIVDSNTDPNKVQYPIPANDDSIRTIQIIISVLSNAIVEAKNKKNDKESSLKNSLEKKELLQEKVVELESEEKIK
jgi:small subunit ribosomal protein S2